MRGLFRGCLIAPCSWVPSILQSLPWGCMPPLSNVKLETGIKPQARSSGHVVLHTFKCHSDPSIVKLFQ